MADREVTVALAGNPNTGKSTLFNLFTGLKQHTGNWPGKTVTRAEGSFRFEGIKFNLLDLPGTYSLLSRSKDEEIARNYLIFNHPDLVLVMADSTAIERNLHLALQILQITSRVILVCNLSDEARRKGIDVRTSILESHLGIPVVDISASRKQGIDRLKRTMVRVIGDPNPPRSVAVDYPEVLKQEMDSLGNALKELFPAQSGIEWIVLRLMEGDPSVIGTIESMIAGTDKNGQKKSDDLKSLRQLVLKAQLARDKMGFSLHDELSVNIHRQASAIAAKAVFHRDREKKTTEEKIDRIVTSRILGLPIMLLLLFLIFYITIAGANYPSELIAKGLFWIEDAWAGLFDRWQVPWWITGFLVHGVYKGLAWVISVMLPPMAIFFPLFTFLEDLGYLPRVAFNLDRLFRWSGAHGKQALTMGMGFGCNAAAIISTRIIDSPKERMIAIVTNNFVPCNGRWPLLILVASIFVGSLVSPALATVVSVSAVVGVTLVGIGITFLVNKMLSTTLLKKEPSSFILELPPYRKPQVLRILYRSLIDRTIFVLGRAVMMAAPAGGLIWILGNIEVSDQSLMHWAAGSLDGFAALLGLDGMILLAYIIAIPANEIVIPTILMGYLATGQMVDMDDTARLGQLLQDNGWTIVTAVSIMLFSVLHYPCSTTTLTIWKETRSSRWTLLSNLIPLGIAIIVCFLVAQTLYLIL
ncbi:MAG TPA: ferrous iron transport protein B [Bacteroides sp.]|nr:ferrous iron transport protein B [Bacteroides sp.]